MPVCVSDWGRQIADKAIVEINVVLIFCDMQLLWIELRIYVSIEKGNLGVIPGPMMV